MRKLTILTITLWLVFLGGAYGAETPFDQMAGANFVFRPSRCSATIFERQERWVLTNYHCVENDINLIDADEVQPDGTVRRVKRVWFNEVTLSQPTYGEGGKVGELTLQAKVLAYSKRRDLAVLQVMSKTFPFPYVAPLPPDNYTLRQGQTVYAIGNPIGMENTLTRGIISHLYREHRWSADQVARYIQTDATIAGGSSGGALYNEEGQLIGVPSAGYRDVNINFAIPITEVKAFLRAYGFGQAWDLEAPSRDEWLKVQEKKGNDSRKEE